MDRLERYGRTASVGADGTDERGSAGRARETERFFRTLARSVRKRGERSERSRAGRRFGTSDGAKRTGDRLRFAAEYSAAAVGQLRRTARRPFPRGDRHQDAGRDRQARLRHGRRLRLAHQRLAERIRQGALHHSPRRTDDGIRPLGALHRRSKPTTTSCNTPAKRSPSTSPRPKPAFRSSAASASGCRATEGRREDRTCIWKCAKERRRDR